MEVRTILFVYFFFSSRRRHTRLQGDWSSDVCSSDLNNDRQRTRGKKRLYQAANAFGIRAKLRRARVCGHGCQIGRASCRERSVDLGGRRIIKKKNKIFRDFSLSEESVFE